MHTKARALKVVPPLKIGVQATHARKRMRNAANAKADVSVVAQKNICMSNAPKGNPGEEKVEGDGTVVNPLLLLGRTPLLRTQKVNVRTTEPQMVEGRLREEAHKCT